MKKNILLRHLDSVLLQGIDSVCPINVSANYDNIWYHHEIKIYLQIQNLNVSMLKYNADVQMFFNKNATKHEVNRKIGWDVGYGMGKLDVGVSLNCVKSQHTLQLVEPYLLYKTNYIPDNLIGILGILFPFLFPFTEIKAPITRRNMKILRTDMADWQIGLFDKDVLNTSSYRREIKFPLYHCHIYLWRYKLTYKKKLFVFYYF